MSSIFFISLSWLILFWFFTLGTITYKLSGSLFVESPITFKKFFFLVLLWDFTATFLPTTPIIVCLLFSSFLFLGQFHFVSVQLSINCLFLSTVESPITFKRFFFGSLLRFYCYILVYNSFKVHTSIKLDMVYSGRIEQNTEIGETIQQVYKPTKFIVI